MANIQRPYAQLVLASALRTASGNSGAVQVPLLQDYTFFLDVTAITSGTTLDTSVQVPMNPEGGGGATVIWFTVGRWAQITTTVQTRKLILFPQGAKVPGDLTKLVISNTEAGTGVISGFAPMSDQLRILWTLAGTNYTFSVWLMGNPRQNEDD